MNLSYRIGRRTFREMAHALYDFRVINEERLHFPGGALVAANHASFFDPPMIGQAFDEALHFFARKTLFSNPIAGGILRSWQAIPIDRDRPDTASLKATIRILRNGGKVLIFPEGTRTRDGKLQPAEAGPGLFIAKADVPVLPIRIFGTFEAYPRSVIFPRPASVTMVVGERYVPDLDSRKHLSSRDLYQSLADELMERIGALSL